MSGDHHDADVLLERVGSAYHAGRLAEAVELCDRLIDRVGAIGYVPMALYWKAKVLADLGRDERARELWDDVARRTDADLVDRLLSLKARRAQVISLQAQGRGVDSALVELIDDELERKLAESQAAELGAGLWDVAYAQMELAYDGGLFEEAVRLSDAIADSPYQPRGSQLEERDVMVRFFGMLSAMMLGGGDRVEERAEEVLSSGELGLRVVARWERTLRDAPRATRQYVVVAATFQASILDRLERSSEARDVLRRAIAEFEGVDEPAVQQAIVGARGILSELD